VRNPLAEVFNRIQQSGYHNHRGTSHSDLFSDRIVADLQRLCQPFRDDYTKDVVRVWRNVKGPDERHVDLLIAAPGAGKRPNLDQIRIVIEHKSVITAHRNRNARFQDIDRGIRATHAKDPRTIVVATLLVGLGPRYLNVADQVKKACKHRKLNFNSKILPRLSTGDQRLWTDFDDCVSPNEPGDARDTIKMFKTLPVRLLSNTHEEALDFLLIIPVRINNVDAPQLGRVRGINAQADFKRMINHICKAYATRRPAWGP